MNSTLDRLCKAWQSWSNTADKTENGWESDFHAWRELTHAAQVSMLQTSLEPTDLKNIEMCWRISEETQDLLEFAKDNQSQCMQTLFSLSKSVFPEVRWQVIEAAAGSTSFGESIVRQGMEDQDPYCRRRAILSFAQIKPEEILNIKHRFLSDPDPLVRKAVESLETTDGTF